MAATEYGKHMGELKRGEQRWDVYLEASPTPRSVRYAGGFTS